METKHRRSLAAQQKVQRAVLTSGSVLTMVSATILPTIFGEGIAVRIKVGRRKAVHRTCVPIVRQLFFALCRVRLVAQEGATTSLTLNDLTSYRHECCRR